MRVRVPLPAPRLGSGGTRRAYPLLAGHPHFGEISPADWRYGNPAEQILVRPVADLVTLQHTGIPVTASPADGETVARAATKEHPAGRHCLRHSTAALHEAGPFVRPRASLATCARMSISRSTWAGSKSAGVADTGRVA